MTITLKQFCAKRRILVEDAEKFRQWLDGLADNNLAERWWAQLWEEFLEEQEGKKS